MSKKNIKNNKKNSIRKNYKIEALEPRLMMSADPVIDFSGNNELNTQLTALYDSIESNLDSKVSSYTSDIKTSGLTLNDANGDAFSNVSDLLKNVSSKIKSEISTAFSAAKIDAQNELNTINEKLPEGESDVTTLGVNSFLGFVSNHLPTGTTASISGSKITFNAKFTDSFEIGELGLVG